jgi:hypothetical protein
MTVRGGGIPRRPLALTPNGRMGPPLRSFAADAHDCIMVRDSFRFFAAEGGLISYGIDLVDQFRRAAAYVDRILKGEKPANLPVVQPSKLINLKSQGTRPRRALVFAAARRRGY